MAEIIPCPNSYSTRIKCLSDTTKLSLTPSFQNTLRAVPYDQLTVTAFVFPSQECIQVTLIFKRRALFLQFTDFVYYSNIIKKKVEGM